MSATTDMTLIVIVKGYLRDQFHGINAAGRTDSDLQETFIRLRLHTVVDLVPAK